MLKFKKIDLFTSYADPIMDKPVKYRLGPDRIIEVGPVLLINITKFVKYGLGLYPNLF